MISISAIKDSRLARSVAVLASGNVFAQLILVASSPILMRLYSPESLGLFAVFVSMVSTVGVGITGKYDVAMMLPKHHPAARQLFGVSIIFSLIATAASLLALMVFDDHVLGWLGTPELSGWIFVVPFAALFTGLLGLGSHLANRYKEYSQMAKAKVVQSVLVAGVSTVLGVVIYGFEGLVIGHTLGLLVATIYIFWVQYPKLPQDVFWRLKRKVSTAVRYRDYPVFFGSTAVISGITLSLPVFFFTHRYSGETVGYYALIMRVVFTPLSFLSAAIFQVNMKEVVDRANNDLVLVRYIGGVARWLFLASAIPAIILMMWAPQLFAVVFGESWTTAGQYAQILAVTLPIHFVATTLSSTLAATRNVKYSAIWKIIAFVSTLVVLTFAVRLDTFKQALISLVVLEVILYCLYFILILKSAKSPRNREFR